MKTYGLKRLNGIHHAPPLWDNIEQEKKRLEALRAREPEMLPKGTPFRNRLHAQAMAKHNKRVKYKEAVLAKTQARLAYVTRKAALAQELDARAERISTLAPLAASHPTLLNTIKEHQRILATQIKNDQLDEFEALLKQFETDLAAGEKELAPPPDAETGS